MGNHEKNILRSICRLPYWGRGRDPFSWEVLVPQLLNNVKKCSRAIDIILRWREVLLVSHRNIQKKKKLKDISRQLHGMAMTYTASDLGKVVCDHSYGESILERKGKQYHYIILSDE